MKRKRKIEEELQYEEMRVRTPGSSVTPASIWKGWVTQSQEETTAEQRGRAVTPLDQIDFVAVTAHSNGVSGRMRGGWMVTATDMRVIQRQSADD